MLCRDEEVREGSAPAIPPPAIRRLIRPPPFAPRGRKVFLPHSRPWHQLFVSGLAHVVRDTPSLIRARGLTERVMIEAGSLVARVPGDGDVHRPSHIIHDWHEGREGLPGSKSVLRGFRGLPGSKPPVTLSLARIASRKMTGKQEIGHMVWQDHATKMSN
jgi:hypothetical protein